MQNYNRLNGIKAQNCTLCTAIPQPQIVAILKLCFMPV